MEHSEVRFNCANGSFNSFSRCRFDQWVKVSRFWFVILILVSKPGFAGQQKVENLQSGRYRDYNCIYLTDKSVGVDQESLKAWWYRQSVAVLSHCHVHGWDKANRIYDMTWGCGHNRTCPSLKTLMRISTDSFECGCDKNFASWWAVILATEMTLSIVSSSTDGICRSGVSGWEMKGPKLIISAWLWCSLISLRILQLSVLEYR